MFNTDHIHVIGGGSWGTTLSILLGRYGIENSLFIRDTEILQQLNDRRENIKYAPGFIIPKCVSYQAFHELLETPDNNGLYIIATPTAAIYEILKHIPKHAKNFLIASKGIHLDREQFTADILREHFPNANIAVLSGPNIAVEILQGSPTAAVIASENTVFTEKLVNILHQRIFRIYSSDDFIGVQVAGALKNVYAIAAGASDGIGYGENTKSALITRALNEITTIGLKMGGKIDTFLGIAGIGDLIVTSHSKDSRNYRVGYALGKGASIANILTNLGQTAEGVSTSNLMFKLATKYQVHLPIADSVYAVVNGKLSALRAVEMLMERSPKKESITLR